MSALKYILCCWIMVVGLSTVQAELSEAEKAVIYEAILPTVTECREKHGVDKDALIEAKKTMNFDAIDPCFLACVFKKTTFIDEKGMFDAEKALEKTMKYLGPENKKIITDITAACSSVNEQKVSDGEAGCERAKLLLECIHEQKKKLQH